MARARGWPSLTKRERALLKSVAWGTEHFGGLTTRSTTTIAQLAGKRLVRSLGLVAVCDGDGFTLQPERWREGWTLTPKGRRWLGNG